MLAAFGLASGSACAEHDRLASAPWKIFACAGDRVFAIRAGPERAVLQAGGRIYPLERRTSSFGSRYVSKEAAYMEDGESAVITGTVGGPYRNCVRSDR